MRDREGERGRKIEKQIENCIFGKGEEEGKVEDLFSYANN